MDAVPLIQAERLSRHYGATVAVSALQLELRRGEVLGLLGPNGAGKSTTLKMLTGNLAPSAGAIRIDGIDLFERPRDAKARLGYLPEQPPLYPELSIEEFLGHCARLHALPKAQRAGAVERAIERCGLGEMRRRLIGNLSKGYKQRVGIAQAILHSPEVVILDEPSVGLDPQQMHEIRSLVRELGDEHGVILSSHILSEVEQVCDRVVIIQRGEKRLDEDIASLRRRREGGSLRLRLRQPPAIEALAALEGVGQVEALEAGLFRVTYSGEVNPAEALAAAAVAGGWGLLELTPEGRDLESLFLKLTAEAGDEQ